MFSIVLLINIILYYAQEFEQDMVGMFSEDLGGSDDSNGYKSWNHWRLLYLQSGA